MTPPIIKLPSHEDYVADLKPVAICSAAKVCSICLTEYDETHSPILLTPCGHIFGQRCILIWFEEDANTCPLDRKELFTFGARSEDGNVPEN